MYVGSRGIKMSLVTCREEKISPFTNCCYSILFYFFFFFFLSFFFGVKVDTDRSGSISARELAQMKMPGQGRFGGRPIGYETARQLLQLFDRDRGGTLDFYEYSALHGFLNSMQQAFYLGDRDRGGTLDANEVYAAVKQAGFDLSQQSLQAYFYKFAGRPMGYGAYGQQAAMMGMQHPGAGLHLDFLGFMKMAASIALAKSRFEWVDADRDGKIDLNEMLVIMAEFADPHGSAAAGAGAGAGAKMGKAGKDAKKMGKKGGYPQQAAMMQGGQYGAQYGQEECVLQ
jgi:peflin